MFPPNTGRGRRQTIPIKDIIDAVFYINAGCKWADLPHHVPPPSSVSYHDSKWATNGTWRRINDALREECGSKPGGTRTPRPRPWTARPSRRPRREYDGGKKTNGRKRHILVDTLGLVIAVRGRT